MFLLDNKTEKQPGTYEGATFADLYKGYTAEEARSFFTDQVDGALADLQSDDKKRKSSKNLRRFTVSAKNSGLARAGFDAESRRIRSLIQKAEDEKEMLSSLDENSSKDNSRIGQLDKDLATLRKNSTGTRRGPQSRGCLSLQVLQRMEPGRVDVMKNRLFVRD